MKYLLPTDNRWIPTVLLVIGAVSGAILFGLDYEGIVKGMISGLAAVGLNQVFKQHLKLPMDADELNAMGKGEAEPADEYVEGDDQDARVAQDQAEYQKRYDALVERYDSVKASLDEVAAQIAERKSKAVQIREFADELKKRDDAITEFDERLWSSLVEYVTIGRKKEMTFRFRDGTEITA